MSGFELMYCGPSIEPGLTGSGLGPFQLYRVIRSRLLIVNEVDLVLEHFFEVLEWSCV